MDESLENLEIQKALKHYKKHKESCRVYYHNRYHSDEEFREKHKALAKKNYHKNKEKIAEKYQVEKKYRQALRRFQYYKKENNLDKYIEKYKEEYELYFKDQSESVQYSESSK